MDRYLAESKENGPNGTYKVYAISSVAVDEIQEDKLTAFIDGVSSPGCTLMKGLKAFKSRTHSHGTAQGPTQGTRQGFRMDSSYRTAFLSKAGVTSMQIPAE